MATMIERRMQSRMKELEKLRAQLDRASAKLEKKRTICKGLGCDWTRDEWFEHRDTDATDKQKDAWFDMSCEQYDVDDLERRIGKLEKSLETSIVPKVKIIVDKRSKEEIEKEIAEEISRWASVGITVEYMTGNLVHGTTPKGKKFYISGNNGITERSLHCYSVHIDGECRFTSGTWYTSFREIKNS